MLKNNKVVNFTSRKQLTNIQFALDSLNNKLLDLLDEYAEGDDSVQFYYGMESIIDDLNQLSGELYKYGNVGHLQVHALNERIGESMDKAILIIAQLYDNCSAILPMAGKNKAHIVYHIANENVA
jgi:hypothetical protein